MGVHIIHYVHAHKKGGDKVAVMNLRDFPEELQRRAKAAAAMQGITLKQLVVKALEEYLKKKKKG